MTNEHTDHSATNNLDRTMPTRQEAAANDSADEAAVRALYQQLMDGWNQGSGEAFAAVFTEDGDLVGFDGTHLKGRQEIAPFHQQLFDKWLKGSRLVGQVKDVRFLSPDIAVMHAVGGRLCGARASLRRSATRFRPSSPRARRATNGALLRFRTLGFTRLTIARLRS